MSSSTTVVADLSKLVGSDSVSAPTAGNLIRHTRDYAVEGSVAVGVLALTLPRDTAQVSTILRYCNEHRIGVQPQGGMTGLAGGAVPIGPCVVLGLERMRTIREVDRAVGSITVEAGVVMAAVQQAAGLAEEIEGAVFAIVSERQGSVSAEHGIGSLKRDFLHLSRSPQEIALMRTLKGAMDPNGILNPGKVF